MPTFPRDIHVPARAPRQPAGSPRRTPEDEPAKSRRPKRSRLKLTLLILAALALSPLLLIALGRFVPIAVTSYMLQSPTKPVQHDWVPASKIADSARKAVVAAEDQKFWQHSGFDVEAMQKAYEGNKRGQRIRGGSTISQQTAKNLFLWPGGGYFRKGLEAGLTVVIEALWSKQRILEVYLNSAEFGPGIYGVEAASRHFFGKPAAQLSSFEAARLAAVLPNPRKWKVASPGPYVLSRAGWIQRQMGYTSGPGMTTPADDDEPLPPPGEMPEADEDDAGFGAPPPAEAPPSPPAEAPAATPEPAPGPGAPATAPIEPEPEGEPAPVPVEPGS